MIVCESEDKKKCIQKMVIIMKPKTLFVLSILALMVCEVALVSAATVTVGSRTFATAGETGTINIVLDSVPNF
jgi:hypothetical protein